MQKNNINKKAINVMKKDSVRQICCPIGFFSQVFDDKWKLFIAYSLLDGQKRFKELCDLCSDYITQKTLSIKLKELEGHGIINRKVFAEVPPRVEYGLTQKGLDLKEIIISIQQWGNSYYDWK